MKKKSDDDEKKVYYTIARQISSYQNKFQNEKRRASEKISKCKKLFSRE